MARSISTISEVVHQETIVECKLPILQESNKDGTFFFPRYPRLETTKVLQRGPAIGYLIAKKHKGTIVIGWSAFNHNDKQFNRPTGRAIALARLNGRKTYKLERKEYDKRIQSVVSHYTTIKLNDAPPTYMVDAIKRFRNRAATYFGVARADVVLSNEFHLVG